MANFYLATYILMTLNYYLSGSVVASLTSWVFRAKYAEVATGSSPGGSGLVSQGRKILAEFDRKRLILPSRS